MKQHITIEQLKEVNSEKFIPLIKCGLIKVKETELIMTEKTARQLTVGKMIECLKDKRGTNITIDLCPDNKWFISGIGETLENFTRFKDEKLCDVLWEAVKYVLEEARQ